MKLSRLFPGLVINADIEVKDLAYDSRNVSAGSIFFAIPGFKQDGAQFVEAAFMAGAAAAVVEDLSNVPSAYQSRCIQVLSARAALAEASAEFFQHPSRELLLIGVTGTKGKTSSTFLLESILHSAGLTPALLGGVVCRYPGFETPATRTTQESYDLQKYLRAAIKAGAKAAVLEVSSHALVLKRTLGCEFDGMLYTNLSEDHLDFHKSMDEYFAAKKILFTDYAKEKNGKKAVAAVCLDDKYGQRLLKESAATNISFASVVKSDFSFIAREISARGIFGEVKGPEGFSLEVDSPLVGQFNVRNILGAVALAAKLGISKAAIKNGIHNLAGVSGRMERVPSTLPFQVFVDFAHNGIALENVLQALRPICAGKLIVVFGAGGDRAVSRREQLGRAAALLADVAVITSDNPRTEAVVDIISAIEAAYVEALEQKPQLKPHRSYIVEPDRRLAIRASLLMAEAGDVVCIAGKGHETGQEICGVVHPFDDRLEAAKILREIAVDTPSKN